MHGRSVISFRGMNLLSSLRARMINKPKSWKRRQRNVSLWSRFLRRWNLWKTFYTRKPKNRQVFFPLSLHRKMHKDNLCISGKSFLKYWCGINTANELSFSTNGLDQKRRSDCKISTSICPATSTAGWAAPRFFFVCLFVLPSYKPLAVNISYRKLLFF